MRISLQPSWILHRWPYRNTSLLLEVFSRDQGRVRLVARGGQTRQTEGVLQAFRAVMVSWVQRGEMGTLTGVEEANPPLMFAGERLWCGWYLNELIIYLLPYQESCPALFASYQRALMHLATPAHPEPTLRLFEKHLLSELGYGLCLDREALTDRPVIADKCYRYLTDIGLLPAGNNEQGIFLSGDDALALHQERLQPKHYLPLKRLLQTTLAVHLQGRPLHSRRMLLAERQRRRAATHASPPCVVSRETHEATKRFEQ